jgi:hypothetical protein
MKTLDRIRAVGGVIETCGHRPRSCRVRTSVVDRDRAVRHGEDHVEEMLLVLPDLGDPALVLDVGAVAAGLEEGEDAGVVAGLAEDVQILGRPPDARVGGDRIGARQQEGNAALLQQAQRSPHRRPRLPRRMEGRFEHGL